MKEYIYFKVSSPSLAFYIISAVGSLPAILDKIIGTKVEELVGLKLVQQKSKPISM